jgi:hypothetical protein
MLVGPDPSTGPGPQEVSGTSFSSPFAAGVAALVWAAEPSLSADAVESILISTAHISPDRQVGRYVDAGAAVADAARPTARILAPVEGASVPLGRSIELNADVFTDGGVLADVRWTSGGRDLGSVLRTFSSDFRVGSQTVTVTARLADGTSMSDQVTINVRNDPPTVEILNPSTGVFIEQSQMVSYAAHTFDANIGGSLPDSAVTWHLDGVAASFAHGHNPPAVALPPTTLGSHAIVVRATDGAATTSANIRINVVADDGVPNPTGVILNPGRDAFLVTNGLGTDGLPVHELVLRTNAPGAGSPPVTLIWKDSIWSDPTGWADEVEIARGPAPTVQLLGLGCGTSHRLSLTAIDSVGREYRLDTVGVTVAPAILC